MLFLGLQGVRRVRWTELSSERDRLAEHHEGLEGPRQHERRRKQNHDIRDGSEALADACHVADVGLLTRQTVAAP